MRIVKALVVVFVFGACGSAQTERPTLAVFKIKTRRVRLPRAAVDRLHAHSTAVMEEAGAFEVVPRDRLLRTLKRQRRRSERVCHTLRCQARIGRKRLNARRSLSLRISRSRTRGRPSRCAVKGTVFDLAEKEASFASQANGGCELLDIATSLNEVLCQVAATERGGGAAAPGAASTRACLAHAELTWTDSQVEVSLDRERRRRREKATWEQRMAELVLDLKRQYDQVARHEVPRWTTAAICRTGRLYDVFADRELAQAAVRAPLAVRREGKEAVAAHDRAHDEARKRRAEPFRRRAAELYRDCLSRARELKLPPHPFFSEARGRLREIEGGAGAPDDSPAN